ncbi:hypothetical protein Bbelb_204610 [Branchiostoma belcheri]|nr:hypothetical protein Bbelb_204610 [Branchiostoma belcheri]
MSQRIARIIAEDFRFLEVQRFPGKSGERSNRKSSAMMRAEIFRELRREKVIRADPDPCCPLSVPSPGGTGDDIDFRQPLTSHEQEKVIRADPDPCCHLSVPSPGGLQPGGNPPGAGGVINGKVWGMKDGSSVCFTAQCGGTEGRWANRLSHGD